ncbi:MAG: hypothetical protein BYD32DRAFT_419576 [Podila humilis]|nr:MAG: hypothetical protein BYD32DRAFT_419576 [Podila humilis]
MGRLSLGLVGLFFLTLVETGKMSETGPLMLSDRLCSIRRCARCLDRFRQAMVEGSGVAVVFEAVVRVVVAVRP